MFGCKEDEALPSWQLFVNPDGTIDLTGYRKFKKTFNDWMMFHVEHGGSVPRETFTK